MLPQAEFAGQVCAALGSCHPDRVRTWDGTAEGWATHLGAGMASKIKEASRKKERTAAELRGEWGVVRRELLLAPSVLL